MTENEAIKIVKEFGLHHAIGDLPNSALTVKAFEAAINALEEIQHYRAIGTVEEFRDIIEINQKITDIVNRQLIAGKDNYKEVYSCFYDIVRTVQRGC